MSTKTQRDALPNAAQLAAEAMSGDDRARIVPWPGRVPHALADKLGGARVGLVILSRQEKLDAGIAATEYLFDERKLDPVKVAMLQPEGLFDFEREIQLLAKILRAPSALDVELFAADELRAALPTDTQEALMRLYAAYERDESPIATLKESEGLEGAKAYLRTLKANGGLSAFLTSCDFGTEKNTALALADLWLEQLSATYSGT